ncbi:DUF859 family phage minor structural protein [Streptococcus equinus]|uniref:DUF859 family phage minor structural protein n=1 Tax=Streptococcus equinus TaxID=1335 RepID=UPI000888F3BB|nr:DUF859 family phage minor structural protein [Streptococcus equinus]QBX24687.1 capsid and scaffold protein [Streptococcus phage Javan202]SDQ66104.1 virus protein of unknown function [Streptococcus equinus]SEN67164.1 virus protein of unknown function [Streptococcus equinus]
MATATFSGQYGHNMTLEVWSGWNRQDVANNRSTVNVQARLITNGYASMWGVTADLTITINGGSAIEHPGINIGTGSSQLIFAHDYVVGHNNDGSKTVGIKISVSLNTGGYGSSMVAFDLKLPNIPRASSGSVTSGDLGTPVKISIDRKVSAFKHTLRYDWNGVTGTIASNVDTSYSWTLPMSFADKIPNATSSWGRVFIDTYNGSTKIGTKEATFTGNVPASVKPTLGSISLSDSNTTVSNLINTSNTFVQVLSNIKVAFNNASGAYSSTISNYHAEIVDRNMTTTSNGGALGIMSFSGSATIRATVTDSRGRTSEPVEVEVNVLPYFTPQLSFTAQRSGSAGTTITVTRNAKIAPLTVGDTQKNTMKLTFKYKRHSQTDDEFTADTGSAGGTWTTVSELVNSQANLDAVFNALTTYDIVGKIEDSFTSYDFSATVGTEKFPLAVRPDGVGLGKVPETANAVDSDWQYYFNNKPIQHYQLTKNDGTAIMLTDGSDLNDVTSPGCYNGSNLLHAPANGWNYIRVTKHTNNNGYVLQEAIAFYGNVSAYRVQTNKTWGSWQYYAVQNKVAEFTAVNQTKVYRATLAGPYGLSAQATRCGNIVNLSINCNYQYQHTVSGTANETIPVGWKPTTAQIITLTGHAGGGTGTENWTDSFADLHYETDGKINFTIKTKAKPLAMMGSITWITTDPFPS